MKEFVDAFVDGKNSACGKEDYGYDKGPEVEFAGETEGVEAVGFALALPDAHQQEDLIQGIGEGMDGFGQHGG